MSQSNAVPDFKEFTARQLLGRSLNDVEEKNAPRRLFVAGDTALLCDAPRVSLVGSRKPSDRGLAIAQALSSWLAERGVVVVSGLAEDVDI